MPLSQVGEVEGEAEDEENEEEQDVGADDPDEEEENVHVEETQEGEGEGFEEVDIGSEAGGGDADDLTVVDEPRPVEEVYFRYFFWIPYCFLCSFDCS